MSYFDLLTIKLPESYCKYRVEDLNQYHKLRLPNYRCLLQIFSSFLQIVQLFIAETTRIFKRNVNFTSVLAVITIDLTWDNLWKVKNF